MISDFEMYASTRERRTERDRRSTMHNAAFYREEGPYCQQTLEAFARTLVFEFAMRLRYVYTTLDWIVAVDTHDNNSRPLIARMTAAAIKCHRK